MSGGHVRGVAGDAPALPSSEPSVSIGAGPSPSAVGPCMVKVLPAPVWPAMMPMILCHGACFVFANVLAGYFEAEKPKQGGRGGDGQRAVSDDAAMVSLQETVYDALCVSENCSLRTEQA